MEVSIIIPTYNNLDNLKLCLRALEGQRYPRTDFEVIIVDDGSGEKIKKDALNYLQNININKKFLQSPHLGPAAARNRGIAASSGNLIIFIGDDIVASENFISEHTRIHSRHPGAACLGLTLWHDSVKTGNFQNFLAPYGLHFSYHNITDRSNCGYGFFYTSNISLGKYWFEKEKFDENFKYPAQEDVELSYRLHKRGLSIVFNDRALAYHRHVYTEKIFFDRRKQIGEAMALTAAKHPELLEKLLVKTPMKLHLFRIIGRICPMVRIKKKYKYLYWELKAREIARREMKLRLSKILPYR
jgi:glycosyltransferase involved in cell wall biosynthesis